MINKMECSDACGCGDCGNRDEDDQASEDIESDEESDLEDN